MKKLDDFKNEYDHQFLPDDLDTFMESSIQKGKRYTRKRYVHVWRCSLATFAIAYLFLLNTSPTFAKVLFNTPLIGNVSRILCLREYKDDSVVQTLHVKVPVVENTGNEKMEKKVNETINTYINNTVKQVQKDNKEALNNYKKQKTIVMKSKVNIDYNITANKGNLLSFQIITTHQGNTSLEEYLTFNLNLVTGKELTLQELFGDSYKDIINTHIRSQIQEIKQRDKNIMFFEGNEGFTGITDDQAFYIDDQGNVVIVFEKYEISVGSAGPHLFKIPCDNLKTYTGDYNEQADLEK